MLYVEVTHFDLMIRSATLDNSRIVKPEVIQAAPISNDSRLLSSDSSLIASAFSGTNPADHTFSGCSSLERKLKA